MFISNLTLRNIRGFGPDFSLDFTKDGTPRLRTVIIGKNGTCKTTLLRSLALGVCWPQDANALIAEPIGPLISMGQETAEIIVTLRSPSNKREPVTIQSKLKRRNNRDYVHEVVGRDQLTSDPFVWAAGAGRSAEGADGYRGYQIVDSVYSLFNYEQTLSQAEIILRRLRDADRKVHDAAISKIKQILKLEKKAKIELGKGGGVFVTSRRTGDYIPLTAWADGYRLTTSWLLDAYAWALRADMLTEDGGIRGILLIDEIEQHIHPSLHSSLLDDIANVFPQAQIFATTHSPLATLGAEADEIISLRWTPNGIVRNPPVADIRGWSALDMLEDDRTFDTEGYAEDDQKMRDEYEGLARQPKDDRTAEQTERLVQLARKLAEARPDRPVSPLLQRLMHLNEGFDT